MKVRITQEARFDLEAIGNWISEENPARAISFVSELQERCRSLGQHPRRFPVLRKVHGEDVRKLSYRVYLILYFVFDDAVEVTHVLHQSRDLPSLFPESG